MASNIRVTLELDNRKYLADLKQADTTTQQFATKTDQNVSRLSSSFDKLSKSTDGIVKRFAGLRTALAGLAFGAMSRNALLAADDLQDLSNSSGIAVARLLELKAALTTAGGQVDQLPSAINTFARSIDEAAQGSIRAQNTFGELGVSLNDLRRLSEQDLFIKALEGIVQISDKSRQAAVMMDMFGKSFRTVDPQELLDKLKATAGQGDEYARSISKAAELNDKLAATQNNLKVAFLVGFEPVIDKLNTFAENVIKGKENIELMIAAVKVLAAGLVAAFASGALLGLVTAIGQVGRGIGVIGAALGASGFATWAATAFAATGKILVPLRAIAVLLSAGLGIAAATQLFDDFGSIAGNALARIVEGIGSLTASILNLPTDAIAGLLGLFGVKIEKPWGLGDGLQAIVDKAKAAREQVEATQRAARAAQDAAKPKPNEEGPIINREVEDALARRRKEIQNNVREFERYNANIVDTINFENSLIGLTDDIVEVRRAEEEVLRRAAEKTFELRKAKEALSKDESALAAEYDRQIELIARQAEVDAKRIAKAKEGNLGLQAIEKARKQDIENITKAIEQQTAANEALGDSLRQVNEQAMDLKFERSLVGLSEYEKQLKRIQEEGRKTTISLQQAFAQQPQFSREDGMTPEDSSALAAGLDQIGAAQSRNTQLALDNVAAGRTWATGWAEAFANYRDSAQNAADQAQTYFNTFTRGVEDAIVKFVQTGKLSFKDLANSIIADFARIAAKNLVMSIFGSMGGGGGNFFSNLFGGFRAAGGPVSANKAYVVGEQGPELFMPKNAGSIVPNGSTVIGGSQPSVTNVTYQIQAVDASSFRSLVARDPEFLFSVTEQGRRSLPIRNRR